MADGRRRESRRHALEQAALVWLLTSDDGIDAAAYLERGTLAAGGGKVNYLAHPGVAEKIEEIQRTGKLIVG
jgi:hypothetical protein